MRIVYMLIIVLLMPIYASNQERDLQAVFLGRFAKFIEWPQNNRDVFIITLIDENPFDNLLDNLYSKKRIHGKKIKIKYVTKIEDIGESDILFITLDNYKKVNRVIEYAQENSILTISEKRGFAQRGGIIQLGFVAQKPYLVINYDSSVESNIKISSTLLAIAQNIIKGEKQ